MASGIGSIEKSAPLIIREEVPRLNPRFVQQMKLVGLVLEGMDLEAVNSELQRCLFQKDCKFYENGGENPNHSISLEQAVGFMENLYAEREVKMPNEKDMGTAIFIGGVDPSIRKRVRSLKLALDNGYICSRVVVVAQNDERADRIPEIFYEMGLNDLHMKTVIVGEGLDCTERGLEMLAQEGLVGSRYTLVSDCMFADKVCALARHILGDEGFNGCAVDPISDWLQDMQLYEYPEKLGNDWRKAMMAFTMSALNFKAREFYSEFKAMAL